MPSPDPKKNKRNKLVKLRKKIFKLNTSKSRLNNNESSPRLEIINEEGDNPSKKSDNRRENSWSGVASTAHEVSEKEESSDECSNDLENRTTEQKFDPIINNNDHQENTIKPKKGTNLRKKTSEITGFVRQKKYHEIKKELENLKKLLANKEEELINSQTVITIRKLRTQIINKETEITKITKERDLQRNKTNGLLAGANELNDTIKKLRKEIANLQQRRQDSGYGDDERTYETNILIQENNRLRAQIKELEKKSTSEEITTQTNNIQLERKREQSNPSPTTPNSSELINNLETEINRLKGELIIWKGGHKNIQKELELVLARVIDLEIRLGEKDHLLLEKEGEINLLNQIIENLTTKRNDDKEAAQEQAKNEQNQCPTQEDYEKLKKERDNFQQQAINSHTVNTTLRSNLTIANGQLQHFQATNNNLQTQLTNKQEENRKLVEQLEQQRKTAEQSRKNAEEKIQFLTTAKEEAETDRDNWKDRWQYHHCPNNDAQLDQIQKKLQNEQVKNQELESLLKERCEELTTLEEELASKNGKIADWVTKLEQLYQEINNLQIITNYYDTQLELVNDSLIREQAKSTNLQNQLDGIPNDWQQQINDAQQGQQQAETERDNWQNQFQQEKNRADGLQTWKDNHVCSPTPCPENCCQNGDYDSIKSQLVSQVQKIRELEQEIKELKNKPPVSPVSSNQLWKTELPMANNEKINDFTNEKASLLAVINQQVNKIKKLEEQLAKSRGKSCKKCEENELLVQNNLPSHKQILHSQKKFCVSCLVGYGIIIIAFLSLLIKIIKGKKTRKKR